MQYDDDQKMRYQQATLFPNTHRFVRPVVNERRSESAVCPPVASEMFHHGRSACRENVGYVPVERAVSYRFQHVRAIEKFVLRAQSDKAET